jgi:hypothetical protein
VKDKPPVEAPEGAREEPKEIAPERPAFGEALERTPFRRLPPDDITALHAAALQCGLERYRGVLLAGLAPSFVATLRSGPTASAQLALDLEAMNRVERLADGTVPLQLWLSNAMHLSGPRREAEVFRRALDVLVRTVAVQPRSTAPSPPAVSWEGRLSGADIKDLTGALLDAFPTRADLAEMVLFDLDMNLDEIAGAGNLRDAAFQLVRTAEAQGFIPRLFASALAERPGNAALLAIAKRRS